MLRRLPLIAFSLVLLSGRAAPPVILGDEPGLFVDRRLVERLDNLQQVLGQPLPKEVALVFDQLWEKAANCVTVIKDVPLYRMYYRGVTLAPDGEFDGEAELVGDQLARAVTWKHLPDVARLAGQNVRLRFVMRDGDLYSFQFKP